MRPARLLYGAIGAVVMALGLPAFAQEELPAGTDRELVATACSSCHDLNMVTNTNGLSREDWDGTLDDMTAYGMKVTPEERAKILAYLATYLAKK
jgi:mono/diheme cytochrome c family protein